MKYWLCTYIRQSIYIAAEDAQQARLAAIKRFQRRQAAKINPHYVRVVVKQDS